MAKSIIIEFILCIDIYIIIDHIPNQLEYNSIKSFCTRLTLLKLFKKYI